MTLLHPKLVDLSLHTGPVLIELDPGQIPGVERRLHEKALRWLETDLRIPRNRLELRYYTIEHRSWRDNESLHSKLIADAHRRAITVGADGQGFVDPSHVLWLPAESEPREALHRLAHLVAKAKGLIEGHAVASPTWYAYGAVKRMDLSDPPPRDGRPAITLKR